MKRVAAVLAAFFLVAATPQEVSPGLEDNGYYIEEGSTASEQVVSDAVFDGRADGGRLYIVVLGEEPPGGATTFSDSTLDLLGDGYVVTVAPETVGWAGEGVAWTADEMNAAIDASLNGGSDDAVVELFINSLTTGSAGGSSGGSAGGGFPWVWILVIGVGVFAIWMFINRRSQARRVAGRLEEVKKLAREKLDEVANDIIEMEDEVAVSDNQEAKGHYQQASAMYSQGIEDTERATTVREMLEVSGELDLAIWELDCVEALLDGKTKPPKPEPPKPEVLQPPASLPEGHGPPPSVPGGVDRYPRRPQRHSTGSGELMTMLMTMMAMGSMRRGGFGGFGGGFGGGRMGGGGFRGGGGRMRGGGRRG